MQIKYASKELMLGRRLRFPRRAIARVRRTSLNGLLTLALYLASAQPLFAVQVGEEPPDFLLPSNSGQSVRLSDYRGKVVLVDFWASWCNSCAQSLPWINELQHRFRDYNFQIITVNLDASMQTADNFLRKSSIDLLVAYDPDGKTPEAFGVGAMPTSYVLSPDGKVRLIHAGFEASSREGLEEQIYSVIKEHSEEQI